MGSPEKPNQPHIPTYWEQGAYPEEGAAVVVSVLGDTYGFMIHPSHLQARAVGVEGVATGHVPGHGGDVWFVRHDGDDTEVICAYGVNELAPKPPAAEA